MNDYRIESLGSTFARHADELDNQLKIDIEKYKENYPDSELPVHFQNPFSIARALSVMACEIEKLKHIHETKSG